MESKAGWKFSDFLVTVLHTFLGFFSEAGEKYALRLADFVHKRLKNERTASVRSSYLSEQYTETRRFFSHSSLQLSFLPLYLYTFVNTLLSLCGWCYLYNTITRTRLLTFLWILQVIFIYCILLCGWYLSRLYSTNSLLADMDEYFAKNSTHSTPHCWISQGMRKYFARMFP